MDSTREYCRCCYSSETLETLWGSILDVYKLICNTQALRSDDAPILSCLQCREFLEEVHRFKIKCHEAEEIFLNNMDIKPYEVELTIDESTPQVIVKTELNDEFEEVDVKINKVEVDYDADNSLETVEAFPSPSFSNITKIGADSVYNRDNMLIECHRDKQKPPKRLRKQNASERGFKCDQCDYCTNIKRDLNIHRRTHLKDGDLPYKCSECSFKTVTMSQLKDHTKRKHSDEKPFSCDQCDYCTKTKTDLTIHKRIHLDDNPFKCTECSFITTTLSQLNNHINRIHSDDKPFACDLCDYRTNIQSYLNNHKRTHLDNSDRPYKCSVCSYGTNTLYQLKNHTMRKHSDDKPFSCDQCNYCTKIQTDLTIHKRIHLDNNENPFKCNECSFITTTVTKLKIHIARKHSDDKQFSCDQCSYSTNIKSYLNNHKRTHLNKCDKPYKCNQCSYRTNTSHQLKDHTARRHSYDKPFSCDQCSYCTKIKKDLTMHRRIMHNEKSFSESMNMNKRD